MTTPSFLFNKGTHSATRVSISDYKGKLSLDIRQQYFDKESETFKPTPKGVSIPLEKSKPFLLKLRKFLLAAEEKGFEIDSQE